MQLRWQAGLERPSNWHSGAVEDFAKDVTCGGSDSPVYSKPMSSRCLTLAILRPMLSVCKTFDFAQIEQDSEHRLRTLGTGPTFQLAIKKENWCKNYQSSSPRAVVSYSNAGFPTTTISSKKSIFGQGSSGAINEKAFASSLVRTLSSFKTSTPPISTPLRLALGRNHSR